MSSNSCCCAHPTRSSHIWGSCGYARGGTRSTHMWGYSEHSRGGLWLQVPLHARGCARTHVVRGLGELLQRQRQPKWESPAWRELTGVGFSLRTGGRAHPKAATSTTSAKGQSGEPADGWSAQRGYSEYSEWGTRSTQSGVLGVLTVGCVHAHHECQRAERRAGGQADAPESGKEHQECQRGTHSGVLGVLTVGCVHTSAEGQSDEPADWTAQPWGSYDA